MVDQRNNPCDLAIIWHALSQCRLMDGERYHTVNIGLLYTVSSNT